ncbi:hypothetical protein H8E88_02660 [candidate division KSB1 bacterium]|nr:hypothetical protein [candidate division KSB1 bacterium]
MCNRIQEKEISQCDEDIQSIFLKEDPGNYVPMRAPIIQIAKSIQILNKNILILIEKIENSKY